MDQRKYTTLVEALADVPDPRKRRGQRYPWIFLLTLVSAALASGQRHGRAIGQWVQEHADALRQAVDWRGRALPSEATLRRVLRHIDLAALEDRLRQLGEPRPAAPAPPQWQGVALDGKELRGARAHGCIVHLVSLVRHDGDPEGAPLAQQALARQIRQQHGHYLMVIKENQPEAYQAIALLFAEPPEGVTAAESVVRTVDKGHGRLEWRTLEASAALADWLRWPGGRQVLRRTCRRVIVATGEVSEEVTYGITSLSAQQANATVLERLWRGHWAIENRVHYPRDVTLGEDAGQAYRGNTPQALAALRNAVLNLFRAHGWRSVADALRHYGAFPDRALRLIGAVPG